MRVSKQPRLATKAKAKPKPIMGTKRESAEPQTARLTFADNQLAQALFGAHSVHLVQLETGLGVTIAPRGADLAITGTASAVTMAERILVRLYDRLAQGGMVGTDEVAAALRMSAQPGGKISDVNVEVHTKRRVISPRSTTQAAYLKAIDECELVFGSGPAGTGKTYLAVAKAVELLVRGDVDRIILSRPAVEAGEQLGFLPGDMQEKVDPYLRPLYDALYDMLPADQVEKRLENGEIEVAPLAFMRGRTLANAFVILDEAQNTTAVQMKMFLTRLGENARMVVTGDLSQVDLPRGIRSGLRDAWDILTDVKGIAFVEFNASDVVRHPIVTRIVNAYDAVEKRRRSSAPYEHENEVDRKSDKKS
ncbi:phosphate starvation-inducible protein PhoH [Magnetovibrio blakemorei]|uniref:PhoH-like protein n=2 Tax=Magnetovibrio blakemorei TaxID=28181 RepID=A0A1E5Q3I1_9PROT|nr:phosphate starvation-inducible protein PhoH [Magnetovibrio blakemorei]